MSNETSNKPVIIKKYANRRLYNTETSSYVTLDYLAAMIRDGRDFQVLDAKTGEDLTRSVLTQIIIDQESRGQTLLPLSFLRQLIGFYGQGMEELVPRYLESSMAAFAEQQDKLRNYFTNPMMPGAKIPSIEEITRKNMAMFEEAAKIFASGFTPPSASSKPSSSKAAPNKSEISELKDQLTALQERLDRMSRKPD